MVAIRVFVPLGQGVDQLFGSAADWVKDGRGGLSNRLWLAGRIDRKAIDNILRTGLATGADPIQVAKDLEDYLTPLGRRTTTRTPRGGKGNFAARRLARTEVTRAFGQATIQAADLNPFVEGVTWSLSSRHGRPDECDANASGHSRGLPAGVYRTDEVPRYPNHPHDLCVLSPFVARDTASVVAQLRQDAGLDSGTVIHIPRSSLWEKTIALVRAARTFLAGSEAA